MNSIKILLAEDHAILRDGLKSLLSGVPEMEVVGEAGDGQKAIQQAIQLKPDIILMDLSMPRMNGTEAIGTILRRLPETKIIVLTLHKSDEYVHAALNAGASGYLLKDDSHEVLITAIQSISKGNSFLSPGICNRVVSGYLGKSDQLPNASLDILTDREREILKLVAEGFKNREISDFLSVSIKTVEKHRSNLMKKLDLHNASALTVYAIENGLTGA